ncbi:MAG: hypothetical protein AB2401_07680 [Bacillus sp. (in: firmicutes)]
MEQKTMKKKWVSVEDILIAYRHLKEVVAHTPLQLNQRLSLQNINFSIIT